MKTKISLLLLSLLFVFSEMKALDKITIGVIQYDLSDIDKSFKELHDQGFGSCELSYQKKVYTKSDNGCRSTRKPLCLEFPPRTGNDRVGTDRGTG